MIKTLNIILSFLSTFLLIFEFGYPHEPQEYQLIQLIYPFFTILYLSNEIYTLRSGIKKLLTYNNIKLVFHSVVLLLLLTLWINTGNLVQSVIAYKFLFVISVILYIIPYTVRTSRRIYSKKLSPGSIFAGSFIIIILIGSGLLMLPNASNVEMNYIDALFTSTSAVCVTGLIVLDTGKEFTLFGQTVILFLIQLGGLGIMTFTTFFAFFFKGGSSYQEHLYIKDFLSSENMGGLLKLALKIVIFTLIIELIGAILIYSNLPENEFGNVFDKIFFSIFHSVSGFCNAGFSTLSNSLYESSFRHLYNIHLVIAFLFIIGGLGFNIIFNIYVYVRNYVKGWYKRFIKLDESYSQTTRILTLNTKLVLTTTIFLILVGFVLFFIFEYNNTLSEHSTFWGKTVTAFFGALTPRTAGFNTVDTSALTIPAIMLILFLMWIGASPASTGGGMKTSTFAISVLNMWRIVTGKDKIEIGTREISQNSIDRAFSIMFMSLLIIGISTFLITSIDPELGFMNIVFECFSAFGTVGLSLGITDELSGASKFIIVVTMFLGRVGLINILIGILKKTRIKLYKYPEENILIN